MNQAGHSGWLIIYRQPSPSHDNLPRAEEFWIDWFTVKTISPELIISVKQPISDGDGER